MHHTCNRANCISWESFISAACNVTPYISIPQASKQVQQHAACVGQAEEEGLSGIEESLGKPIEFPTESYLDEPLQNIARLSFTRCDERGHAKPAYSTAAYLRLSNTCQVQGHLSGLTGSALILLRPAEVFTFALYHKEAVLLCLTQLKMKRCSTTRYYCVHLWSLPMKSKWGNWQVHISAHSYKHH